MIATFLSCVVSNVMVAGCLAVFAMVVTRAWRSPHVAHALWLLVLVKLVTPPIVYIPVDRFMVTSHVASTQSEHAAASEPSPDESSPTIAPRVSPLSTGLNYVADHDRKNSTWETCAASWPQWLLTTWGIGTVVFISVGLRGHLRLRQLIANSQAPDPVLSEDAQQLAQQMGFAACPPLRVTDAHVCPFVAPRLRKQAVVLPKRLLAELNRDQIRSVLAHELAHIRRRDHWTRIFEVCVLSLNWWNPIAWWSSRQRRRAEEECCDALVVWALPESRRTYGQTLLQAVEYLTGDKILPAVSGTSFGGGLLERRIDVILHQTANRRMSRPALALTLVMSAVILPVGVTRAFSEDQPTQNTDQRDTAGGLGEVRESALLTEKPLTGRIYVHASLSFEVPRLASPGMMPWATNAIMAIDPNTGQWKQIPVAGSSLRVSPDGTTIAYQKHVGSRKPSPNETLTEYETWTYDMTVKREARLSELDGCICWSPDGKHVVLSRPGDDAAQAWTWLLSRDGVRRTRLPILPTDQVADWSPDGNWLVATSCRESAPGQVARAQLYRMRPDGSHELRLTQGGHNVYPRVSPDGRRIVYLYVNLTPGSGGFALRSVDSDGKNDREIFSEEGLASVHAACWSPDGRKLAALLFDWRLQNGRKVIGGEDPHWRIAIMDPNGKNRRELKLTDGRINVTDRAGQIRGDVNLADTKIERLGGPDWR